MSNSKKNPADETTNKTVAKAENNSQTLYDFTKQGKGKWRIQNDVVMGGRSESQLKMTDENYAFFTGRVSLENNGGFCSIHQTSENEPFIINKESDVFILNVKGDGKDYNFRIRTPKGRHSYAATFSTNNNGDWEAIAIPFKSMQATYRGEVVNVPNYDGENLVEMQILIGNKKEEDFEILLRSIAVN